MQRVETSGANGAYDEIQARNAKEERQQRERVQAAEVELLDGETYRAFCQRRREMNRLLVEPETALDEASFRDYRLRRDSGER